MAIKDNIVFKTALQFSSSIKGTSPEAVLYGYAKLLLMDESSVKNLIPEEWMKDLDEARAYMEENKLDLTTIRSGLLLLVNYMTIDNATLKAYREFEAGLETDPMTFSVEVLKKAIAVSKLPIKELFKTGKTMEDIFSYQEILKEEKKSEPQQEEVRQPEESPSEETPSEEKPQASEAQTEETSEKAGNLLAVAEKYRALSSVLLETVKGQDKAVLKFVQGCFEGELLKNVETKNRPRSYFFFFGPPGTGKTLLAETAAENMGLPHYTFNMSEYSLNVSAQELLGNQKMGFGGEGNLTTFVKKNPECVLIFDEIEKAHINVIRLFLQILGSGKIQNAETGKEISFTKAILIFTSNVGKDLYADRSVNLTSLPENVILSAIQGEKDAYGCPVLPSEICSRIASGNMILFNHLSTRHLVNMVNTNLEKIASHMESAYDCHVTYARTMPLLFLFNRGGGMDARVATGQSGNFIKNEIYELTRQLENAKTKVDIIRSIHLDVEWEGVSEELKQLFFNKTKSEVLLIAGEEVKSTLSLDNEKYLVHVAKNWEEAVELMKHDVIAAFVDPAYMPLGENEHVLSISDYDTEGIRCYRNLVEKEMGLPIYLIETGSFSNSDRRTFIQQGAADIVNFNITRPSGFVRQFEQIIEEQYMEKESQRFCSQGWVIDYDTKQVDTGKNGELKVLFYNLKKRKAIDADSRRSFVSDAQRPEVSFADIIGAKKAKEELQYFIDFLKNPKQFLATGEKPPKGVLLYGPPGTGKTMLAKAMAGESDVSFIQTSASEFKDKYVGASEENIRKIFAKARQYAPAIIFIDEIDAIGKKRTGSEFTATTESMLNALLTEMDGFSSNMKKPVFVLAATNYGVGDDSDGIAALDPALVRRFDNRIYVDLPNQEERKIYLNMLIEKKKLEKVSKQAVENIAERTTGQSLAILQNIVELAARNAGKAKHDVTDNDLLNALEEYIYGEKKERTPEYYQSVSIHETGHAYISYLAGDAPSYITIESRGNFGGYMQHGNTEDIPSYTKEDLLGKIRTSLAGRAAEIVFYGNEKAINTGASSDLKAATRYAFAMLCSYGMGEHQLVALDPETLLKSSMADHYIKQVNALLEEQMAETIRLVEQNKETIEHIANELVKRSHLTGQEFKELCL